jgi:hypothetical protein
MSLHSKFVQNRADLTSSNKLFLNEFDCTANLTPTFPLNPNHHQEPSLGSGATEEHIERRVATERTQTPTENKSIETPRNDTLQNKKARKVQQTPKQTRARTFSQVNGEPVSPWSTRTTRQRQSRAQASLAKRHRFNLVLELGVGREGGRS